MIDPDEETIPLRLLERWLGPRLVRAKQLIDACWRAELEEGAQAQRFLMAEQAIGECIERIADLKQLAEFLQRGDKAKRKKISDG